MKKITLMFVVLAMMLLGALPVAAHHNPNDDGNTIAEIVTAAADDGQFQVLLAALQATDLDDALAGDGPFTVFAPTDQAFIALADGLDVEPTDLLDRDDLADILLYHVVPAALDASTIRDAAAFASRLEVETLNGTSFAVRIADDDLFINDSQVITADIEASNGVIHVIDQVLIPNQRTQSVDSDNGTIADVVVGAAADMDDAEFGILLRTLTVTGLDAVLADPDANFTVFAPTDAAFLELADDLGVEPGELPESDALADILLYHVVPARLQAADIAAALGDNRSLDIQTVNGEAIRVTRRATGLFINNSALVDTDIIATNGVIHVIDAVLLPDAIIAATTQNDH